MICPKCGAEYQKGIVTCPACNTPTENNLSYPSRPERIKLVPIYKTSNPVFISLVKSILESENILYYFKGEGLQDLCLGSRFGIGNSTLFGPVEIQVDESYAERAREILEQIENSNIDEPQNEGVDEMSEENKCSDVSKEKKFPKGILAGIIIGILISIVTFCIYKVVQDYRIKQSSWYEYGDLNADGKNDAYYYYEKGILTRVEQDRNFDGKIDYIIYYKTGIYDYCLIDDNYDGVFETKYIFQKGIVHRAEYDYNNDKNVDLVENYINGIIYDSVSYHEITGKIWKKVFYRYGIINEEQIDQDFDGEFDIVVKYNEIGRPIKTINLAKSKSNSNLR